MLSSRTSVSALLMAAALVSRPARAGEPGGTSSAPQAAPPRQAVDLPSILLFAGGAASGLTFHELGHVVANLAYGNVPGVQGISYEKAIPWFAVDPRISIRHGVYYSHDGAVFRPGGRGYYVINTAGFMAQNLGSEIILTTHPRLRYEHAPFSEGLLWMNMMLSIGYASASLIGVEDRHGDIYGGARNSTYPHQFIAGMALTTGTLDLLRYFFPDSEMLPWLSRTAKVMFLGMDIPLD